LTLLKIPSRKNRKGPLSRKQIRQKTNLLSDFRKYLFQTDYEIEQSLQTDQKLNLEHWEKAGCSYKIMNLDQQEELVKYLLQNDFTENQIGDVARVHKMVTNKKLFKARKSIRLVKEKTLGSLHHEIETGVEYFKLKKKSDKIERKITYWRLKNPSTVVENWLNRDISKICFHTSQNPAKIQLSLTGDHFANTYGFYLGRANVLEPNSPLNFLPLACIAHSSDDREIIYKIIQPVIQNLMSLTEVDLDFSEFQGLPRSPPPKIYHEWENLPSHKFSTPTEFRSPEALLCYQPGEIKFGNSNQICSTCHRKFEKESDLLNHERIDHESRTDRNKISSIHPDFEFYSLQKKDGIPKNTFLAAFDALIYNP